MFVCISLKNSSYQKRKETKRIAKKAKVVGKSAPPRRRKSRSKESRIHCGTLATASRYRSFKKTRIFRQIW